ncbi:MAG: NUDIX domain-containing protein [Simkaniaceae bacterium]|nr:NUDIX domain-containing protein [Simkaniaceae bacterium]MCF7852836.1 NUDIX domain-containing protein [Simkaniaceae bacterium]
MNYLVVVECIIQKEDRFLMIQRPEGGHAGGLLAFPGGKVDFEDGKNHIDILENALKREVNEEVGLDLIDQIQFVTSSYFVDTYQKHVLDVIFYCSLEKTHHEVNPSPREVADYFWLTFDEILNHPLTPSWVKIYLERMSSCNFSRVQEGELF